MEKALEVYNEIYSRKNLIVRWVISDTQTIANKMKPGITGGTSVSTSSVDDFFDNGRDFPDLIIIVGYDFFSLQEGYIFSEFKNEDHPEFEVRCYKKLHLASMPYQTMLEKYTK